MWTEENHSKECQSLMTMRLSWQHTGSSHNMTPSKLLYWCILWSPSCNISPKLLFSILEESIDRFIDFFPKLYLWREKEHHFLTNTSESSARINTCIGKRGLRKYILNIQNLQELTQKPIMQTESQSHFFCVTGDWKRVWFIQSRKMLWVGTNRHLSGRRVLTIKKG